LIKEQITSKKKFLHNWHKKQQMEIFFSFLYIKRSKKMVCFDDNFALAAAAVGTAFLLSQNPQSGGRRRKSKKYKKKSKKSKSRKYRKRRH
jgi:hypothetical protein